ncbi:MAG: hypothetical protein GXP15_05945 [Gammaproteobacteria bacterium]|nr:hypothetical protein [Gammaproteobacteria bacterium]
MKIQELVIHDDDVVLIDRRYSGGGVLLFSPSERQGGYSNGSVVAMVHILNT